MIVIDSSVIFKWFVSENEDHVEQALHILDDHLRKRETIILPELFKYEVANSWATKSHLPLAKIKTFLKDLGQNHLEIKTIDFKLISKAVTFSKKYKVSVYDAVYAVLAKERKCKLFTADAKFVMKVNLPFVKHLREHIVYENHSN